MATAQVIFHRFYYVSSMLSFGVTVGFRWYTLAGQHSYRLQDISVAALYLSTKLNETPIRLRDLINTYIFLSARTKHLLSLPADQPLGSIGPDSGPSRLEGNGANSASSIYEAPSVKGKEKERSPIWDGFMFEVPGFHDEIFWECTSWLCCAQHIEQDATERLQGKTSSRYQRCRS